MCINQDRIPHTRGVFRRKKGAGAKRPKFFFRTPPAKLHRNHPFRIPPFAYIYEAQNIENQISIESRFFN